MLLSVKFLRNFCKINQKRGQFISKSWESRQKFRQAAHVLRWGAGIRRGGPQTQQGQSNIHISPKPWQRQPRPASWHGVGRRRGVGLGLGWVDRGRADWLCAQAGEPERRRNGAVQGFPEPSAPGAGPRKCRAEQDWRSRTSQPLPCLEETGSATLQNVTQLLGPPALQPPGGQPEHPSLTGSSL